MTTSKKPKKKLANSKMVSINFGKYWDKTYGNTYTDATVRIDNKYYNVPSGYLNGHGNCIQNIHEALNFLGYKQPDYERTDSIHAYETTKKYRELNK